MAQCHKRAFVTPPSKQGDSSTWTAPELTRSWSEDRPAQVSPLGQADKIQPPDVRDLLPTRSTLAPPLTGLTYGLQVIEGLNHAGLEFRSLAEDFDTATSTGKLQLSMVLAFSEWWRNSIRDRSVAGQAKARAEGRFPGRRPSLSERQREYIRVERSKGVSQRELAKRLEVSRWTIQQADR